jgi:hypothetical protein
LITYLCFPVLWEEKYQKIYIGVFLCSGIGLMQMNIREWSNMCLREFEIFVLLPF